MKTIFGKSASILALVIGVMAIIAGGRVLLGADPGYYVIKWLPLYNYTDGILAVFTAVLIWNKSRFAAFASLGILGLHALVMLLLQTAYRSVVAPDSIQAMTLRLVVWMVIVGLIYVQIRKNGLA